MKIKHHGRERSPSYNVAVEPSQGTSRPKPLSAPRVVAIPIAFNEERAMWMSSCRISSPHGIDYSGIDE
jgi:hypothetical protein